MCLARFHKRSNPFWDSIFTGKTIYVSNTNLYPNTFSRQTSQAQVADRGVPLQRRCQRRASAVPDGVLCGRTGGKTTTIGDGTHMARHDREGKARGSCLGCMMEGEEEFAEAGCLRWCTTASIFVVFLGGGVSWRRLGRGCKPAEAGKQNAVVLSGKRHQPQPNACRRSAIPCTKKNNLQTQE